MCLLTPVSSLHLSVVFVCQLSLFVSCLHLSVVFVCQLSSFVSCLCLSVVFGCQLSSFESCLHLSVVFVCQLSSFVSCLPLFEQTTPLLLCSSLQATCYLSFQTWCLCLYTAILFWIQSVAWWQYGSPAYLLTYTTTALPPTRTSSPTPPHHTILYTTPTHTSDLASITTSDQ